MSVEFRSKPKPRIGIGILLWSSLLISLPLDARGPAPVPDNDLIAHQIIVVAKWPAEGQTIHQKIIWNAEERDFELAQVEGFTSLEVLRVIKGTVPLGKCRIRTTMGLCFPGRGPQGTYMVWEYGSSGELPGDTEDITSPCLWFLSLDDSWQDGQSYPTLTTRRGIQPIEREPYFLKLLKESRTRINH